MAGLSGMKDICNYVSMSEATILNWIRTMDFPAKKLGGIWMSDTELIDRWRINIISGTVAPQPTNQQTRPEPKLTTRQPQSKK